MGEHVADPTDPTSEPTVEESEYEPARSDTEGMTLSPEEHHPGPEEEEAQRREKPN